MIPYLYNLAAYFLLYSFLGWCLEVAYHAVCKGVIVNRGFLSGPVCPIYGAGMIAVLTVLYPFTGNFVLMFAGGMLFATAIELFGGFAMYKLFHMRWWDYSNEPFNLGGYVCLKFSIAWGLCIVFAVTFVHPLVELNVYILSNTFGYILMALMYVIFILDTVNTVLTILKLNKNLKRLNALSADIRAVSDELTEKIGTDAMEAEARMQERRIQAALGRAEARDRLEAFNQEMAEIRSQLVHHRHYGYGRLLRAFPEIGSEEYQQELREALEKLRQ